MLPLHPQTQSTAVATAVACWIYAACPTRPTPEQVISVMRRASTVGADLIASPPPFSPATVQTLREAIRAYTNPPAGKRRKLDAPGVLNLPLAAEHLTAPLPASAPARR